MFLHELGSSREGQVRGRKAVFITAGLERATWAAGVGRASVGGPLGCLLGKQSPGGPLRKSILLASNRFVERQEGRIQIATFSRSRSIIERVGIQLSIKQDYMIKSVDSGARLPKFMSQFYHLLMVWP